MVTSLPDNIGNYRVLALLGEGSSGTVFRVEDARGGHRLALKRLHPQEVVTSEIKREFRLAADLRHPNVVLPYTLERDGEGAFLTMELVEGEPLLEWLARQPKATAAERTREVFRQLCDGLAAIHAQGLVHRDVKSSNVLVEGSGRVAILDLGLARAVSEDELAGSIAGTFAYLAPEVLANQEATAAADAYAVGVLLHQVITGRLPFDEAEEESVWQRVLRPEGPDRDSFPPGNTSLVEICRGLLVRDPKERWTLARAREALAGEGAHRSTPAAAGTPVAEGGVWGRDAEIAALGRSWQRARAHGRAEVVLLEGPSGIGKSTVLAAFARRVSHDAWVLQGRAYEGDALPYRGLDGAFDHLAQRLMVASAEEQAALLPPEPEVLSELFPVLGAALGAQGNAETAALTAEARDAGAPLPDAMALRRRAVTALQRLLSTIAQRHGLVLLLDDVHCGDPDSARLLRDLLRGVEGSALVVLAYRSDRAESAFVREAVLLAAAYAGEEGAQRIRLAPLDDDAVQAMARGLAPGDPRVEAMAPQAQGSPFLLQLLLSLASASDPAAPIDFTVEAALRTLVGAVPPEGLRILETVSLARQPLDAAALSAGADTSGRVWPLVDALTRARLVRPSSLPSARLIEPYHDRIRELVVEAMDPRRKNEVHRALGAFFAEREGEAYAAAQHLAEVGENARARALATRAAEQALAALAFDHALRCNAFALRCAEGEAASASHALELQRGRILASAGRCAEAAPILLACADRSEGLEAEHLRREAMEHFLVAGRVDDGRAVMKQLLEALGVSAPTASWRVQIALVAEVVPLLLRGPVLGKPREQGAREQLEFETYLSIGKGYASYDGTLGTLFFLRAARRALAIGDAPRAVRGIAYVATLLGFGGSPTRAHKWIAAGERIATERGDGHAMAFCELARGMVACCAGQWQTALATFDASVATLIGKHAGSAWEVDTAKTTSLVVLLHLGGLRELSRRAKMFAAEAEDRGDLALGVESSLYHAVTALLGDDVVRAHACADEALVRWTNEGYHFQHWIGLRMRTMADLYAGESERALARLQDEVPKAQSARLTAMQLVRVEAADLTGRAAYGALAKGKHEAAREKELRATLKRCIRDLEKEGPGYAVAPATMLRAGLARLAGDQPGALAAFARAAETYRVAEMRVHAAAAAWHEATLAGDATRLAAATAELAAEGVESPARWAGMHLAVPSPADAT